MGSREGYFETYEVSVLLDYLQILDNERQDLPLAAVLTSPFAGLDARELAKIRSTYPELFFYEAVHAYASDDEKEKEPILQQKLKNFLCRVSEFRDMLPYTAMHDLLWEIIEKTGYGMCISAMPGGAQRMANVQMLVAQRQQPMKEPAIRDCSILCGISNSSKNIMWIMERRILQMNRRIQSVS